MPVVAENGINGPYSNNSKKEIWFKFYCALNGTSCCIMFLKIAIGNTLKRDKKIVLITSSLHTK